MSRDAGDLARENAKLRKINEVLMRRVERSMDMQGNDYALFETAIEEYPANAVAVLNAAFTELQLDEDPKAAERMKLVRRP